MKRRYNVKTAAVVMAGAIAFTSGMPAVIPQNDIFTITAFAAESKYSVKTGEFASRLRNHYGPVEFEIHFNNYDKKDNKIFNSTIAKAFKNKAKIRVNDGAEYSFKDIEIENDKSWDGSVNYHIFKTQNKEFIKTFVNSNPIKVEIKDPDGNIVKASIKNDMSDKEKEDFLNSSNEGEKPVTPVKPVKPSDGSDDLAENLKYEISKNSYMTRLKNDSYTDEVIPKFQMAFVEKLDDGTVKFNVNDAAKMDKYGYIIVNGGKKWSFKDANLVRPNYGMGQSNSSYETKNLEFIKEFAGSDNISVKVILDNKVVAKGSVPNNLSADEKAKFPNAGESQTPGETEKPNNDDKKENSKFYEVKTQLMHSSTGDNYPYTEISMAGAIMADKGEIVETSDGKCKLIVHFKVAEVMGARAYGTRFELSSKKSPKLKENEEGDVPTEFIAKGDDSGILIVDIPKAQDIVYEGYVYSNIMSNTAALKVSNIRESGNTANAIDKLISELERNVSGKNYYDRSAFDEAIKNAKKNKTAENYIELVKAAAELREKLNNPFENGDLFFVPVKGSSAFANPPGTSNYIVKPWARVEKKNGKTVLTVDFDTYSDWSGKQAVSAVKVYGEDEETEVNIDFEPYSDGTGKLSFEMPFYPESGTYKTVLTDLTGREWPTDLILDYAHMHKGMRPELIKEAMEKYDSYNKDWVGHEKGKISEDKEDEYTESSFKAFLKVLKKCENDLAKENRKDLTQDIIDRDVELIKNARENLVYKAGSGTGYTVNEGALGIDNPGNVYTDEGPHIVYAPWSGSKIIFAGHRYKVLNNGFLEDDQDSSDTGNIFIMADNFVVEEPWCSTEPSSTDDSNVPRWDASYLREYLNGEFYDNFTSIEKSLIKETDIETQDATTNLTSAGIDRDSRVVETRDKIFIADISELKSRAFGFASQESRKTDEYYFVRNLGKGYYESNYKLMGIKPKGTVESFNQKFTYPTKSYPAMNIDKSKILMTISDSADISAYKKVQKTENNIWKLVVRDDSITIPEGKVSDNGSVKITGDNVYAFTKDESGKIKAFGKVSGDFTALGSDNDEIYLITMKSENDMYISSEPILLEDVKMKDPITPDPPKPSEGNEDDDDDNETQNSNQKSMDITAVLNANTSGYSVNIPSSLANISLDSNNTEATYHISVKTSAGYNVSVAAETEGVLRCGKNELKFTNDFGLKRTNKNAEFTGKIKFNKNDIKKAAPGKYTGTTNFIITTENR